LATEAEKKANNPADWPVIGVFDPRRAPADRGQIGGVRGGLAAGFQESTNRGEAYGRSGWDGFAACPSRAIEGEAARADGNHGLSLGMS